MSNRADLIAHERDDLAFDDADIAVDTCLEEHEACRHLPFQAVVDADHGAFGNIGMVRHHLLHRAR